MPVPLLCGVSPVVLRKDSFASVILLSSAASPRTCAAVGSGESDRAEGRKNCSTWAVPRAVVIVLLPSPRAYLVTGPCCSVRRKRTVPWRVERATKKCSYVCPGVLGSGLSPKAFRTGTSYR